jgi:hypothetical protein
MNNSLERITKLINQLNINENEIEILDKVECNEVSEVKEDSEEFLIESGIKKLDFEIITEDLQEEGIISINYTKEEEEKKEQRYLTITDSETGKTIKVPIFSDHINSTALKKLNIASFDPGYMNTSAAKSKITFIDGDKGILEYRGYSIEDLAARSSFEEVSFLLINGVLPTKVLYL